VTAQSAPVAVPGGASLRARLLWRVLPSLAVTWLAGSAIAVAVAWVLTERAFDGALLDDAHALAANVVERDGQLAMTLSSEGIEAVLFDQHEQVFFSIVRADGSIVAGNGPPLGRPLDRAVPVRFADRRYRGEDLRTVELVRAGRGEPFAVVVGQTTHYRTELLERLLLDAVVPQAVLLLALGAWLRWAVGRELRPLGQLQEGLDRRDAADLRPIELGPAPADVQRLGGSVNGLMARVGAGVQAQREFAGNVAHELRTPLAGIRALAEYGLSHRDPAVWEAQLQAILASQARASHLIDQLLALALADEARDSIRLEPLRIDEIAREALLLSLPKAHAAGVDLGAVGLDAEVSAMGHAGLVEGIVHNLVDNALRYATPAAGSRVHVTLHLGVEGDAVRLAVSDDGPGIEAERRGQLLRRWEHGPRTGRTDIGSGLGLAIVQRYVDLLGGRLELTGAPEGGLLACVWLRRVERARGASRAAV
jgi:two-component system sensor histidine kinase TctE